MSDFYIFLSILSFVFYIFIGAMVIVKLYDDLPLFCSGEEFAHTIIIGVLWPFYFIGLVIKFIAFTLFTIVKDINKMIDDIRHFE